jgi:urease accessory protein
MQLSARFMGCLLVIALFPISAFAHVTAASDTGFMAGLTHPIFGLDHLTAMLSVGIVSTQLKHKYAIWTLPATFVSVMAIGGLIGMSGIKFEGSEIGIALSVLVLGTSIYFGSKLPVALIYAFVAFFAICHGYAHGAEMPEQAHAGMFVMGFMIATVTIHLAGVSVGLFSTHINSGIEYLRFAGGVMAGMGFMFLLTSLGLSAA